MSSLISESTSKAKIATKFAKNKVQFRACKLNTYLTTAAQRNTSSNAKPKIPNEDNRDPSPAKPATPPHKIPAAKIHVNQIMSSTTTWVAICITQRYSFLMTTKQRTQKSNTFRLHSTGCLKNDSSRPRQL